jgi:WD40 repeat protein
MNFSPNRLFRARQMIHWVLVFAFLLSACGGKAAATPAAPTPTEVPAGSATAVPEQDASPTSLPPTATPAPSLPSLAGTPAPTPSGAFESAGDGALTQLARWGTGRLYQTALSPDRKTLAVATATGLFLYDAATLEELPSIAPEKKAVLNVIFSPDGAYLAVQTIENTMVYSFASSNWSSLLPISDSYSSHTDQQPLAFSLDSQKLAVFTWESGKVYDLKSGKTVQELSFPGNVPHVNSIWYTPDGQSVIGISDDYLVTWNIATGKATTVSAKGLQNSYAFSPDGATLALARFWYSGSGYSEGTWLVDPATGQGKAFFSHGDFNISAPNTYTRIYPNILAMDPQGRMLAVAYRNAGVCLWNLEANRAQQCLDTAPNSDYEDQGAAFSPDGRWLFTFGEKSIIRWDTSTWTEKDRWNTSTTLQMLFPAGEGTILTVQQDNQIGSATRIRVWDLEPKRVHIDAGSSVRSLTYLADGKTLVTGGENGIRTWNAADGSLLKSLDGDVLRLAVSPDGKLLVAALSDNTIQLYSLPDLSLAHTLQGHTAPVTGLYFHPAEAILVSVSAQETLVWDLSSGQQKFDAQIPGGAVTILPTKTGFTTVLPDLGLYMWKLEDGSAASQFLNFRNRIKALAGAMVNSGKIIFQSADQVYFMELSMYVQNLDSKQKVSAAPQPLVCIDSKGELAAVNLADGVGLLDTQTGKWAGKIIGAADTFAFAPDTQDLAVAAGSSITIYPANQQSNQVLDDFSPDLSKSFLYTTPSDSPFFPQGLDKPVKTAVTLGGKNWTEWRDLENGSRLGMSQSNVVVASVSSNGQYIVLGMQDPSSGTPIFMMNTAQLASEAPVQLKLPDDLTAWNGLAVSDTGLIAAALEGYGDSKARQVIELWDAGSSAMLYSFPLDTYRSTMALSADGKRLAIYYLDKSYQGHLTLWDITDPVKPVKIVSNEDRIDFSKGILSSIRSLALTSDEGKLAAGLYDGSIALINSTDLKMTATLSGHAEEVTSLTFLPDGQSLLSASADGTLRLWGASDLPRLVSSATPTPLPASAQQAGSPAVTLQDPGQLEPMTTGNINRISELTRWQLCTRATEDFCSETARNISQYKNSFLFKSIGEPAPFILRQSDHYSQLDPYASLTPQPVEWNLGSAPYTFAISPDGTQAVIFDYSEKSLVVIDNSGNILEKLNGHTKRSVIELTFSPDGRFLASAALNDYKSTFEVFLWDLQNGGKKVGAFELQGFTQSLAITSAANGAYTLYVNTHQNQGNNLYTYSISASSVLGSQAKVKGFDGKTYPNRLASSADSTLLAVGMGTGEIRILDAQSQELLVEIPANQIMQFGGKNYTNSAVSIAFLDDNRGLLVSFSDGSLRLYGVKK